MSAETRRQYLTPSFKRLLRGTTRHATYRWVDPHPVRGDGVSTRSDRLGHAHWSMLSTAVAQAKGWDASITYVRPRKRDRVTVTPFRSPQAAYNWIVDLTGDPMMGRSARSALRNVDEYLARSKVAP